MRWIPVVLLLGASACRIESSQPTEDALAEARTEIDTIRIVPAPSPRRAPPERAEVLPSGLVVPVLGVAPTDLVDTFDEARNEGRVHDAIDILAPRGTPVVAATAGRVARLFESERGGLTVYVLDGLTVYYYAHLDAYAPGLEAGQAVARGERLGAVGSTGNASAEAPHLHFAVWRAPSAEAFWDGEALNPYTLLTGRR